MADHVFRTPAFLRSADNFVRRCSNCAMANIANGFWTITTNAQPTITMTIKNNAGNLVASTQIKYAVFDFAGGNPYNDYEYMRKVQCGVGTTDGNGVLVFNYKGTKTHGDKAYVAILHPHSSPSESMIWAVTIA